MARLPEACDSLAAALEKAAAELAWVEGRLEEEFAAAAAGGGPDALGLLKRIHRLQRELPGLGEEVAAALAARQRAADVARSALLPNAEALARLERRAGVAAAGGGGAAAALGALLEEHAARINVGALAEELSREHLNDAFAHSLVA